jgi:naphthalene 1,2-dioxygenase system ferredoxin subunit
MSDALDDLPWHDIGDVKSLFAPDDAESGQDTCATRTAASLKVEGVQVALFNVEGQVYAIDDRCTHGNAYLSEGDLDGFEIECPMHAGVFDVRTGAVLCQPATRAARCHQVRIEDGAVFIRITPRS